MNRAQIVCHPSVYLPVAILFAISVVMTPIEHCQAAVEDRMSRSIPLELRYERGLISGSFENIPLGRVLDALVQNAGLRVRLTDPAIAQWPVSAVLQANPSEQAVTKILRGFSYMLLSGTDGLELIVLSAPSKSPGRDVAETVKAQPTFPPEIVNSASQATPEQAPASLPQQSEPLTLDDFQHLTIEEVSPQAEAEGIDLVARAAQEQEYHEALLQRALDALSSTYTHLHAEALEQLATINDPRAAAALIEVVSSTAADDASYRFRAVAALVRHAEEIQFSDAPTVNLLQQLAFDSDLDVRGIARQALVQIEQSKIGSSPETVR